MIKKKQDFKQITGRVNGVQLNLNCFSFYHKTCWNWSCWQLFVNPRFKERKVSKNIVHSGSSTRKWNHPKFLLVGQNSTVLIGTFSSSGWSSIALNIYFHSVEVSVELWVGVHRQIGTDYLNFGRLAQTCMWNWFYLPPQKVWKSNPPTFTSERVWLIIVTHCCKRKDFIAIFIYFSDKKNMVLAKNRIGKS